MRIELFTRLGFFGRKHYFRVRATNGQIIAHSEAYSRRVDAESTARSLILHLEDAFIVNEDDDRARPS